ncbi:MAG: ABC transporter ATP-binding protein [Eubacteriales bacterium]|nr:ABC transporter ATP-binding protein [Eubacteriales bacterium]
METILDRKARKGIPAADARAALLRLYRYMTSWRRSFAVMIVLLMLSLGCDLVTPLFIEASIDAISFGRGIYISFPALTKSILAFILVAASGSVLECVLGRICAKITLNMSRQLRQDAFDGLMDTSVSSFEGMLQGDLMSRIMNDAEMASGAFSETFRELACSVVMLTGCAVIMMVKCPFLAIVSIGSSIVSVVIMGFLSGLVFPVLSEQQASLGRLNAHIEESLKTFRTCRTGGRMQENIRRIDRLSADYCEWKIRAGRLEYLMGPVMLLLGNLNFLLVLFFGISRVRSGLITVGAMQSFIMYTRLFMEPVNSLGEYFVRAQNALAGAERVFRLIDGKKERDELAEVPAAACELPYHDEEDFLVFDSVGFGYRRNFPVLKGVSLRIRKGEKLALIGKTGEGKTTLTNLLLLFYPGYSGSILLEGCEIRKMDIAALRQRIAAVSQDPLILNGTVYENLVYGCGDIDRERVWNVLCELGISGMFSRLPEGLDTKIRNIGCNLSQGQLQMICLARALLRRASILILDEATSSLDPDTEHLINRGMKTAIQGKTCILIAHRISSVRDADHIAVLSDGVISEYGTHEELIERRGLYCRLYQTQFSGEEI